MSEVTICVPVYNVEKYIERCARSLFEQTVKDLEFIFIDDCSKDGSIEVLKRVMNKYPERKGQIRIIRHDNNKGLAGARNTAVENCETEFLLHVDSDDYIDLNTVEECLKNQKETGSDIVTYGVKRIKNGIERTSIYKWNNDKEVMMKRLLRHEIGHGVCGRMIRTSLYKDNGIKVEVGRGMSEDLQVTPRLFYFAKKITYISSVFYYYFLDNESSYVASFSIEKFRDSMAAIALIKDFFSGNKEYIDAIEFAKYKSLADNIKGCARAKADIQIYNEVRSEFGKEHLRFFGELDLPTKIAMRINNYRLLKLYINGAWHIKNLIKKYL